MAWKGASTDTTSSIYVVGDYYLYSGLSYAMVAKYNSSGTIQWQRKLSSSTYNTFAQAIATTSSGDTYVVLQLSSSSYVYYSMVIVKYNSSGTIQWQRSIKQNAAGSTVYELYIRRIAIVEDDNYMVLHGQRGRNFGDYTDSITFKLPTDGSKTGTITVSSNDRFSRCFH